METKVSEKSPLLQLLHELRGRIIRVLISIIIIILLCMTMSITTINFDVYKIPIIYPSSLHSISIQIITFMKNTLLPKNVTLIQIAPAQAFTAQIYVAIMTAMIVTFPLMLRELFAFIEPALHFHEKRIIKNIMIPSIGLFTIGCLFSFYIVIPYTIDFLYKYGQAMGVSSFFDITQFISFVINSLVLFGFSYQFPLVIWALTKTKIVKPRFWRNNFRYVLIILIILGAFITPDGSGVTMWFVVGPLVLLYIIGMIVVESKFKLKQI